MPDEPSWPLSLLDTSKVAFVRAQDGYHAEMMKSPWSSAVIILFAFFLITIRGAFSQNHGGTGLGNKLRSQVEQGVLRKLKPFFPKAQIKLDQNGTLIILTCARNLGPVMLRKIQPEIEDQFYSADLAGKTGLALTRTKRVGVGFEREILIFNLASHQDAWIDGSQVSGYAQTYPEICNQ